MVLGGRWARSSPIRVLWGTGWGRCGKRTGGYLNGILWVLSCDSSIKDSSMPCVCGDLLPERCSCSKRLRCLFSGFSLGGPSGSPKTTPVHRLDTKRLGLESADQLIPETYSRPQLSTPKRGPPKKWYYGVLWSQSFHPLLRLVCCPRSPVQLYIYIYPLVPLKQLGSSEFRVTELVRSLVESSVDWTPIGCR